MSSRLVFPLTLPELTEPGIVKSPRPPHSRPDLLLRFLRGEATLAERREVMRHLLAGCRECIAITRPVWRLADAARQPQSRRKAGG